MYRQPRVLFFLERKTISSELSTTTSLKQRKQTNTKGKGNDNGTQVLTTIRGSFMCWQVINVTLTAQNLIMDDESF